MSKPTHSVMFRNKPKTKLSTWVKHLTVKLGVLGLIPAPGENDLYGLSSQTMK